MDEDLPPEEGDDDEFFNVLSVHYRGDENAFCTLEWLEWDHEVVVVNDDPTLKYGIPEHRMN